VETLESICSGGTGIWDGLRPLIRKIKSGGLKPGDDPLFNSPAPEVNFGHFPAGDTTAVLTEHLRPKHGLYYALTGKMMTAKEAERIGLISKAVPPAELNKEVAELAKCLTEKSSIALKAVKEAWYYSLYAVPDVPMRFLI
jgi:hypothetical protein